MVRYDCGDVHLEFACAMAVKQIVQTMVKLGDHDQDPRFFFAVMNCPLHVFSLSNFQEFSFQGLEHGCLNRVTVKAHPDKKAACQHVVKLLHVSDVAFSRGQEARNCRHRTHATVAGGVQNVVGFAFERNIHVVSALCWSDKVGDVASRAGCFSQFR